MKKMLKICLVLAAILVIGGVVIGWLMAGYTMSIHPQTLEEARKWQEDHYDLSWYDRLEKQDYTVDSYDGYTLHVQLLRNPGGSTKYVILSHGYTDNRIGSMKYAWIYLELGFHVIAYDLRGHGLNEPTFCTYSAREGRDLDCLVKDTRSRYPELTVLGLHGESLGAASTIACLGCQPEIDFAVADCPFSDIETVLKDGARASHVPTLLMDLTSIGSKLRNGYSFRDMRPIDAIRDNQIPVLFFHGAQDSFILPAHSQRLQEADPAVSQRFLIEGAGHAESVLKAPEDYKNHVSAFLGELGLLG